MNKREEELKKRVKEALPGDLIDLGENQRPRRWLAPRLKEDEECDYCLVLRIDKEREAVLVYSFLDKKKWVVYSEMPSWRFELSRGSWDGKLVGEKELEAGHQVPPRIEE